jgi:hypothetical protein
VTVNADGLFDCSPDVSFVGGDSFKQRDDFVTWVAAESRRSISVPGGVENPLSLLEFKEGAPVGRFPGFARPTRHLEWRNV